MSKKQQSDIPDEETKSDKPKKAFDLSFTVWTDGEITSKLVEYIKKERGAPEKWQRTTTEFVHSYEKFCGEKPTYILAVIADALNVDLATFALSKVAKKEEVKETEN